MAVFGYSCSLMMHLDSNKLQQEEYHQQQKSGQNMSKQTAPLA